MYKYSFLNEPKLISSIKYYRVYLKTFMMLIMIIYKK